MCIVAGICFLLEIVRFFFPVKIAHKNAARVGPAYPVHLRYNLTRACKYK